MNFSRILFFVLTLAALLALLFFSVLGLTINQVGLSLVSLLLSFGFGYLTFKDIRDIINFYKK